MAVVIHYPVVLYGGILCVVTFFFFAVPFLPPPFIRITGKGG